MYNAFSKRIHHLVMLLAVTSLRMPVMIIIQEKVFVSAVRRKCHRRNAQAGEAALKSVPSCERSIVSPRLAADNMSAPRSPNLFSILRKGSTHCRAHGSFAGVPAAAANALGSKPVRFGRGALRMLGDQLLAIRLV